MLDMPYFMENEKWYFFDGFKKVFVLTDEAPEKARKSYDDFYAAVRKIHG